MYAVAIFDGTASETLSSAYLLMLQSLNVLDALNVKRMLSQMSYL